MIDIDETGFDCLSWSEANRRIRTRKGVVSFSINRKPHFYPFLIPIYQERGHFSDVKRQVTMKPRQVGATTYAQNAAFYAIAQFHVNVIYVLPSQTELNDMAGARIDQALNNSPNIRRLFGDISNTRLKTGHSGSLYFRGAQSSSGLEEVPAGLVIRDELDYMDQENAALVLEALGGSDLKWQLDIGHPTSPGEGIHAEFLRSSMSEWYFKCPHCDEEQHEDFFENVDIENHRLVCAACGKEIAKDDMLGGYYKAKEPDNPTKGHHFTQLLSPEMDLETLIDKWERAEGISYKVKIFYNTNLGLPYAERGRKLTEADVRARMLGGPMKAYGEDTIVGIDVGGNALHYWVEKGEEVLRVGVVGEWAELDQIMESFQPKVVVIDAGPELHEARNYMLKLREQKVDAWLCRRSGSLKETRSIDSEKHVITSNMVEQLDRFYARLGKLVLPYDFPQEGIDHLCDPVRSTQESSSGITKGKYIKGVCHFADAGSYASEMSIPLKKKRRIPLIKLPMMKKTSLWHKF